MKREERECVCVFVIIISTRHGGCAADAVDLLRRPTHVAVEREDIPPFARCADKQVKNR